MCLQREREREREETLFEDEQRRTNGRHLPPTLTVAVVSQHLIWCPPAVCVSDQQVELLFNVKDAKEAARSIVSVEP